MLHINEILVILIIIMILFGSGKFPKIMQNFAEGIKAFKKSMNNNKENKKIGTKKKKSTPKKNK